MPGLDEFTDADLQDLAERLYDRLVAGEHDVWIDYDEIVQEINSRAREAELRAASGNEG